MIWQIWKFQTCLKLFEKKENDLITSSWYSFTAIVRWVVNKWCSPLKSLLISKLMTFSVLGLWLCSNNIYRGVKILCFQWANCSWYSSFATSRTCCNFCGNLYKAFYLQSLFAYLILLILKSFTCFQQRAKRMPGIAVTKSVIATEHGGKNREEIFVDVIEKISITFSSSVSTCISMWIQIDNNNSFGIVSFVKTYEFLNYCLNTYCLKFHKNTNNLSMFHKNTTIYRQFDLMYNVI